MARMSKRHRVYYTREEASVVYTSFPEEVGWPKDKPFILPTYVEVQKKEQPKVFAGPLFRNLSNRVPVVRDHEDIDGIGVHTYGERRAHKYTVTGAFDDDRPTPKINKPTEASLLSGLPATRKIDKVSDLTDTDSIFFAPNSGTVHAVIDSSDKKALRFYRRYYDLSGYDEWVVEGSKTTLLSLLRKQDYPAQKCYMLTADGRAACWGNDAFVRAYIARKRGTDAWTGRKWDISVKGLTIIKHRDDNDPIPANINPHYVLMVNTRYAGWKDDEKEDNK